MSQFTLILAAGRVNSWLIGLSLLILIFFLIVSRRRQIPWITFLLPASVVAVLGIGASATSLWEEVKYFHPAGFWIFGLILYVLMLPFAVVAAVVWTGCWQQYPESVESVSWYWDRLKERKNQMDEALDRAQMGIAEKLRSSSAVLIDTRFRVGLPKFNEAVDFFDHLLSAKQLIWEEYAQRKRRT